MNFNTDVNLWRGQAPVRIVNGFVWFATEKSQRASDAVARFSSTNDARECMIKAGVIVVTATQVSEG